MAKPAVSTTIILMADDDDDDRILVRDALAESKVRHAIYFVENGTELLRYLNREGKYQDSSRYPLPNLILLDLNMPGMDGREALQIIKSKPDLRVIPVVILTTSGSQEDVLKCYDTGASSFITKPVNFDKLVSLMHSLGRYWTEFVELPNQH